MLENSFRKEGYRLVDIRQSADVVVVNTCTVTANGDADTRKIVNKVRRLNPEVRVALIGCQAQIQREELLDVPNIHWVVGNARKMELPLLLKDSWSTPEPQVITPVIGRKSFTSPTPGIDRRHTRANLKIQDGCDFFCSFCVIPYARGRARSREFDDILRETKQLVAAGHQELVLTGINVGTYSFRGKTILDVVQALENLPALRRIRISSIEPTTIPFELIEMASSHSKLCRYFHIPLQSGSDEILQRMGRRYNTAEFAEFLQQVSDRVPGSCLGTDVIVGFPGESDRHFEDTYCLLKSLPLAYFHVFGYSERPRAKSRKMGEKVKRETVEKRSKLLRELSQQKRNTFLQTQIGTVQEVLFEQEKRGYWSGLTDTYVRVRVTSEIDLKNQLLPVRLERIDGQTVIGMIL